MLYFSDQIFLILNRSTAEFSQHFSGFTPEILGVRYDEHKATNKHRHVHILKLRRPS